MSLSLASVQSWNLMEIEAPSGTRDPMVVHSGNEARAVVIVLTPGQKLGDHQVKENAWITVLEGSASVSAGGETVDATPGCSSASIRTSATRSRATTGLGSCCCSRRGPARATTAAAPSASVQIRRKRGSPSGPEQRRARLQRAGADRLDVLQGVVATILAALRLPRVPPVVQSKASSWCDGGRLVRAAGRHLLPEPLGSRVTATTSSRPCGRSGAGASATSSSP